MRFGKTSLTALATLVGGLSHVHGFVVRNIHLNVNLNANGNANGNPNAVSSLNPPNPNTGTLVQITHKMSHSRLSLTQDNDMSEDDYDDDDDDDDDDEYHDEGPLSDGVESVSWLPPISNIQSTDVDAPTSVKEGTDTEILPLFPLGGIVYTPNSEHVLNIFEPRYRQMYTDILMNGSKRFVVSMSHPNKRGTFAEIGVVFYLDDLKEVSEETGDQIKYICNHRVTQRVKLHKILNPDAWESGSTYLKVEATILDEADDTTDGTGTDVAVDENIASSDVYKQLMGAISDKKPKANQEKELVQSFSNLVDRQHEVEEDVRFTKASVGSLAVRPGDGEDGLWMTIRLWQNFIEQRLLARQNEMQMEFQEKLMEFLKKEKGIKEDDMPSAIGFQDLSPALQQEVQDLQKQMSVELQPMVLESTLAIQKILEAEDHHARCELLKYFMDAETKRLEAKKTLQGMFNMVEDITFDEDDKEDEEEKKDIAKAKVDEIVAKEVKWGEGEKGDQKDRPSGSIIMDEPDAFQ